MGVHWLRRSESKLGTGVFGWYSFPVIQDVQLLSANFKDFAYNAKRAVGNLKSSLAFQPAFAV